MLFLKYLLMSAGIGMLLAAAAILSYDLYLQIQYRRAVAIPGAAPIPPLPPVRWRTGLALVFLAWAPMLLAFILGPLMEEYLRRAMLLSRGNPWVFVQRPISATLLGLAVLAMCSVLIPAFSKTREEVFVEGSG